MIRTIALVAFVFQVVDEPTKSNAGLVTVYGVNTPAQVEVREADSIEVPVTVMQFDGTPDDGYRSVQASIRYDSARLQFVGATPIMAGTLSKPIDSPRTAGSTWRRVTVTWEAPADVRELGPLFTLQFKVLPLSEDAGGSAVTTIGWDAAIAKDAANTIVKHKATAPTALLIKQDREITLLAPIVIKESAGGSEP